MEPTPLCKRCGKEMRVTAKISPMGGRSGLVVFFCDDCCRADTVLIEAEKWDAVTGRNARTDEG